MNKVFNLYMWILVDCVWADWEIGECSKECGSGTRSNVRIPKIRASNGGKECAGSNEITEVCNTQKCSGIFWLLIKDYSQKACSKIFKKFHEWIKKDMSEDKDLTTWYKVDCEWKEWEVGQCSKECGGGIRTNVREPKTKADHGGDNCVGSSNITESCNTHECPSKWQWFYLKVPYLEFYMVIKFIWHGFIEFHLLF